ncbi:hypothetical protein [Vulcanococcus limneticus]|uniref:hypothetical protein n=1 Tax=Vulcanococcus limneticus TaxID=2170428 RepID=UPI00398C215A
MKAPLTLRRLHGGVHRFCGVVDRFGGFEQAGQLKRTVCIRNLKLADNGQTLAPDHWWFKLRLEWTEAGIQQGDTVLFTAKVHRCTKGWSDPQQGRAPSHRRRQVVGPSATVRDIVVTGRDRRDLQQHTLRTLAEEVEHQQHLLQMAWNAKQESDERCALMQAELEVLSQRQMQATVIGQIPEPPRPQAGPRHGAPRLRLLVSSGVALGLGLAVGSALRAGDLHQAPSALPLPKAAAGSGSPVPR